MSEASDPSRRTSRAMTELKVSGHLMTLEAGLYCVIQSPSRAGDAGTGLPGVRLSLPPGPHGRPEAVMIRGFRDDGWLHGAGDAALLRVSGGVAQVLVTIYQAPDADAATAPSLQVVRLLDAGARQPMAAVAPVPVSTQEVDMLAHVQGQGDVGCPLGTWVGERGSQRWVEGFAIAPRASLGVLADDIEYQAVLGRGWSSPWVEGGQFCGSRGMALPILGLRVRLRGASAKTHECFCAATFVDGSSVGPVAGGEACESESLAPVESFAVAIRKRGTAGAAIVMPADKAPPAAVAERAKAPAPASGRAAAEAPAKPPRRSVAKKMPETKKPPARPVAAKPPARGKPKPQPAGKPQPSRGVRRAGKPARPVSRRDR